MSDRFPDDFLWGAATSAYQIEGSPTADGAGRSIWHRFSHTPGNTYMDQTGDVACDHYRRYQDDVAIMSELGLNAYRFSIAWSRIYPQGTGVVNKKGIDFYSRLVDALLEKGSSRTPRSTTWDLPEALDDRGGWLNRDIADWFCDYAVTMFEALGDRVEMWSTLNEPWVVTDGGYLSGVLAPGHSNLFEAPIATHNLLRAHGTAVERFRSTKAAKKGKIGIVVNLEPKYPASESPEDLAAVRRADAYMNRQYLDPVFLGEISLRSCGRFWRGVAGVVGRRHAAHQAADRLPRRQLLHAASRAVSSGPSSRFARSTCRNRSTSRPIRTGRYFPRR